MNYSYLVKLLFVVIILNVKAIFSDEDEVKIDFILQRLDHFDNFNNARWAMKYMFNEKHYEVGGPIFIYVAGEEGISERNLEGHIYEMSRDLNAIMFQTEHRYYGDSLPTIDISSENLKYLTIKQALADLAHFIQTIKEVYSFFTNAKVILFGASYSGGLVVWFKHLYPDLADGVWASSPVLYAKLEFPEWHDLVLNAIEQVDGTECYKQLKEEMVAFEGLTNKEHENEIKDTLELCENFDISNEMDVGTLFHLVNSFVSLAIIYHSPAGEEIQNFCDIILDASSPLRGVIKFLKTYLIHQPCNDLTYHTYVNTNSETSWHFGNNHIFGPQFTPATIRRKIEETNKFYESLEPQRTNIFITHGELDPWRVIGQLPHLQSEFIPMYGHVKDLDAMSSEDTAEMTRVKKKIESLISDWIE